ncbi:Uncharacterised protein [Candidatus Burarchaeum australiense]|nr:Uncharacterised protein [Candidatus Burarchaeum australiense]
MNGNWIFGIAVVMLLMNVAWADITFTSSTVTPSTLRPGVSGTASFVVTNTGTTSITGLSFDISGYGFDLAQKQIVIGDIGAGGSTQVTVPFKIRSDIPAGIYTLQASTLLSLSTGGTATSTVARTFTIPVTVSNPANFDVVSSTNVSTIGLGDSVKVHLIITNTGGTASNVRLSANSSNFLIKDASQIVLGDIAAGERVEADVTFVSSSSLTGGTYSIPVKITYEDALGTTNSDGAALGPVRVMDTGVDFMLSATTGGDVHPGDRFPLRLVLDNSGTGVAYSSALSVKGASTSSGYFTVVGSADQEIGDFAAGDRKVVNYDVGVDGATPPGYYALNVTLEYVSEQGQSLKLSKQLGIEVVGRYDVSVIGETSPKPVVAGRVYSLSLQVSNTGTGDLKAVSAELLSNDQIQLIGTPYGFIGELKDGDYSSAQYDIYVKPGLAPGRYPLKVNVSFFDAYNREHDVMKLAYVDIVSPDIAALASGAASGPSGTTILISLIVLAIAAWYANKKGWLEGVKARLHMGKKK